MGVNEVKRKVASQSLRHAKRRPIVDSRLDGMQRISRTHQHPRVEYLNSTCEAMTRDASEALVIFWQPWDRGAVLYWSNDSWLAKLGRVTNQVLHPESLNFKHIIRIALREHENFGTVEVVGGRIR